MENIIRGHFPDQLPEPDEEDSSSTEYRGNGAEPISFVVGLPLDALNGIVTDQITHDYYENQHPSREDKLH